MEHKKSVISSCISRKSSTFYHLGFGHPRRQVFLFKHSPRTYTMFRPATALARSLRRQPATMPLLQVTYFHRWSLMSSAAFSRIRIASRCRSLAADADAPSDCSSCCVLPNYHSTILQPTLFHPSPSPTLPPLVLAVASTIHHLLCRRCEGR